MKSWKLFCSHPLLLSFVFTPIFLCMSMFGFNFLLLSYSLFHFLTRLTQDKELSSCPLFHFLTRLTQDHELSSYSLITTHDRRSSLPRGSHLMGEQCSGKDSYQGNRDLVPMPSIHNVQHH